VGVLTRPGVTEHLEGLLVDGLLLVHPLHNRELAFRDAVTRGSLRNVPRGRAPGRVPRTMDGCAARAAGDSQRPGLQYGNRDFDSAHGPSPSRSSPASAPPILAASPNSSTVRAVALELGLTHLGRFATAYRQTFGESPSDTLRGSCEPGQRGPSSIRCASSDFKARRLGRARAARGVMCSQVRPLTVEDVERCLRWSGAAS
jgi:AraC-like DNA-binding protein